MDRTFRLLRASGAAAACAALLVPAASGAQQPPYAVPPAHAGQPSYAPPARPARAEFAVDPVLDGGILAGGGAWAILSSMIIQTGEIAPQQIPRDFDTENLLRIDRVAVDQRIDQDAGLRSNVGLFVAFGYAGLDSVLSGVRERNSAVFLVDAVIYTEGIVITTGITNLAKLAVRRPRPIAYIEKERYFRRFRDDPEKLEAYSNADTDSALSFFSGHAADVACVAATATYLAFARSPRSWRPWVTLVGGLALTTFVSIERVRSGAHFPTDVITGTLAGAGIGITVAHTHRKDEPRGKWIAGTRPEERNSLPDSRSTWVGFSRISAESGEEGGVLTFNGLF